MLFAALAGTACTPAVGSRVSSAPALPSAARPDEGDLESLLSAAEAALEAGQGPRAAALFGRYIASAAPQDREVTRAYLGWAAAHEQLRDCASAVRALDAFLVRANVGSVEAAGAWARRGACLAELADWQASAESYAKVRGTPELLPSLQVEALAREGFAWFQLDRFEVAEPLLIKADEVWAEAVRTGRERFANYYFLGMARFYRAAIHHRRFRELPIRLPEQRMAEDFENKLAALVQAQEAYQHTIRARHMFFVSAAGYQLGSLFEEFYDAMMHAPVPHWLSASQRAVYYDELKRRLRPVVDKAIWVFEKNLETARRLGYASPFIERTEERLGGLTALLLATDERLGRPDPRLLPEAASTSGAIPDAIAEDEGPVEERRLFVPAWTAL